LFRLIADGQALFGSRVDGDNSRFIENYSSAIYVYQGSTGSKVNRYVTQELTFKGTE
jgi:hypothetical protein